MNDKSKIKQMEIAIKVLADALKKAEDFELMVPRVFQPSMDYARKEFLSSAHNVHETFSKIRQKLGIKGGRQ